MTTEIIVVPAAASDLSVYELHPDEGGVITTAIVGEVRVGRISWQDSATTIEDVGERPDVEYAISELVLAPGEAVSGLLPSVATGDPVPVFSVSSGPAWLSVNAATGEITGTAPIEPVATRIVVKAENVAGNDLATINVVVEEA